MHGLFLIDIFHARWRTNLNQFFTHTTVEYSLLRAMPLDFSSDCECPNCLESIQNESDWNPRFNKSNNNSWYSRLRKKSMRSSSVQCFPSQCCSTRPENDTKEDQSESWGPYKENQTTERGDYPRVTEWVWGYWEVPTKLHVCRPL